MKRGFFWIIFALALAVNLCVQGYNRQVLKAEMLRCGVMLRTADDASYLRPAENFLARGQWRSNADGRAAFLTRSPGYGAVYLSLRYLLEPCKALVALHVVQALLYALAVALIPQLCHTWALPRSLGLMLGIAFACWPAYGAFTAYTLTEGLTVPGIVLFYYFLQRWYAGSPLWPATLTLAALVLVRPALLVLVLAFVPAALQLRATGRNLRLLTGLGLALLPLALWQGYVAQRGASFFDLHPIYHSDASGLYRPLHSSVWSFHKSWGQSSVDFHSSMALLQHSDSPLEDSLRAQQVLEHLPPYVRLQIGSHMLQSAYSRYAALLRMERLSRSAGRPWLNEQAAEQHLGLRFKHFTREYRRSHFWHYAVAVPLQVYATLSLHSHLPHFLFQQHWRQHPLMTVFRFLSALLHAGIMLSFPFAAVAWLTARAIGSHTFEANPVAMGIICSTLPYLMYLCLVQRGVEERYITPFAIPMALVVVYAGSTWARRTYLSLRQ